MAVSTPKGEPCLVAGCRWGSTGTAGGWGPPACDFATSGRWALTACLGAWIADEDCEADLDTPYAEWALRQIEGGPDAAT